MRNLAFRCCITSLLIFSLMSHQSMAGNLQVKIIANPDLHSGNLSDGTVLAFITIYQMGDKCNLNIWEQFAKNEAVPGYYTLYDTQGGGRHLNVRLAGENWQPDVQSGTGVMLKNLTNSTTLKLLLNGDQFIDSDTWPINISFLCKRN